MYDELAAKIDGRGRCCLLLDEIQEIEGWGKAVNSLLESGNADIYATGSPKTPTGGSAISWSSEIITRSNRKSRQRSD